MGVAVSRENSYSGGMLAMMKKALSLYETVELRVPTDVLKRADLMCMYIQEETECLFEIESLLEILYFDFVGYAIKNYNPSRVLKEASRKQRNFNGHDAIILQMDGKEYKMSREQKIKHSSIEIKMPKREYQKGQLILDELEALYGYKIPFEVMLSNLLINFIEDYKEGINKRAYTSILKILKKIENK